MASVLTVRSGLADLAAEIAGEGMTVAMLHAGVADRRMWRDQLLAFAESPTRYRTVAYDRRGFGDSLYAEEDYSQTGDLLAVLDATSADPAVLVGCSQGGRIAVDFALAYPGRVRALVLVAPAISGAPEIDVFPPRIEAWFESMERAETARDIDQINAIEAHAWLDGPECQEGRVGGAVRELFLAMNDIALRAERRGTESEPPPAYGRLVALDVPTLLVWGDLDFPHLVERCAYVATQLPQAKTYVMRGTAHLPNLERPAEFNNVLLRFCESL